MSVHMLELQCSPRRWACQSGKTLVLHPNIPGFYYFISLSSFDNSFVVLPTNKIRNLKEEEAPEETPEDAPEEEEEK